MPAFLKEAYGGGDQEGREVIGTSFLGNLPFPQEPGHDITEMLDPLLRQKLLTVRPAG